MHSRRFLRVKSIARLFFKVQKFMKLYDFLLLSTTILNDSYVCTNVVKNNYKKSNDFKFIIKYGS